MPDSNGASGAAGAGQGGAAQDKGQCRYKGARRRAQLCHGAVLPDLADPEVSQALPFFIHRDADSLSPEPGASCTGAYGEPIRGPESSGWAEEEKAQCPALTSAEDDALIGDLVLGLEARAVPALVPELVLAFVNGNLYALDGRGGDIRVAHTHLQLPPRQPRQGQAHRVGVQHRL